MGRAPGHPIMAEAISRLAAHAGEYVLQATGPGLLTGVVRDSPHLPEILPSALLYPYAWDDPGKPVFRAMDIDALRQRFPAALAVTHWAGTWL